MDFSAELSSGSIYLYSVIAFETMKQTLFHIRDNKCSPMMDTQKKDH